MRRILQLAVLPILALLALVLGGAGPAAAAARVDATPAASCTGTIQIDAMTFTPPTVTAGQGSDASVTATNCTAQPVSASLMWYGRFLGPDGQTLPPGCPVMDPLVYSAAFPAGGQYTGTFGLSTFPSCTATSFQLTATFTASDGSVVRGTATLNIQPIAQSACHVVYTRSSEWQGGFVASITITDNGTAAVNGWTLGFTFGGDQHIGYVWGATGSQTGETVTLTATPSDSTIAPGATLSGIGFTGTWHTSDLSPAAFTLNGAACA